MNYRISGIIAMMALSAAAQAADYRLVYSPSQKLEVFIDDVESEAPASWCDQSIPLRIVSAQSKNPSLLNDFLPRVGSLLAKQCPDVTQLPWTLEDKAGEVLAEGNALKAQSWRPILKARPEVTPPAEVIPPEVPVTSPLADATPLQAFDLPQGCRFRTHWENGEALFVPSDSALRCTDGWLNGNSTLTLQQNGQLQAAAVTFFQGYPLVNLNVGEQPLLVVSANPERLVLGGGRQASGSYLLLPFDQQRHSWVFGGTIIVEMPRLEAGNRENIRQRIGAARDSWRSLLSNNASLTFKLVDSLAADRVDPASGSYLSFSGSVN